MQSFMRQELLKLESFKVATALQLLLSRFGHPKEAVRDTILVVLAKLAREYPSQCAWWIFHFLFFEDSSSPTQGNKRFNQAHQAITRAKFAQELFNKIAAKDKEAYEKIMKSENIFGDLKKLSEKAPAKQNDNTMDCPKTLQSISATFLVMPIEENLSPQLPPPNYKKNFVQKTLVRTSLPIYSFDEENIAIFE